MRVSPTAYEAAAYSSRATAPILSIVLPLHQTGKGHDPRAPAAGLNRSACLSAAAPCQPWPLSGGLEARTPATKIRASPSAGPRSIRTPMKRRDRAKWEREMDSHHRPLGYEPSALLDCAIPRLLGRQFRRCVPAAGTPRGPCVAPCASNHGKRRIKTKARLYTPSRTPDPSARRNFDRR